MSTDYFWQLGNKVLKVKLTKKTLSCLIFSLMILTCKEKSWIWSSHQCWKVPTIGLVRRCLLWWPHAVARLKEITIPDTYIEPHFSTPNFFGDKKWGSSYLGWKKSHLRPIFFNPWRYSFFQSWNFFWQSRQDTQKYKDAKTKLKSNKSM